MKISSIDIGKGASVEEIETVSVPSEFKALGSSEIVVGIGMGLRRKDNVPKVLELAEKLDASVGGTRPLVDFGFLPRQQQIGITGSSISPKVYLAIGISGQDNHVVGIRYAKTVIGINRNSDAPIFNYSDYGVVMDAMEFIQKFSDYLSNGG